MPETDGRSLGPVLTSNTDPDRPDETFSEHLSGVDATPSRMASKGPWKLYTYHGTPPVLYNLKDDPGKNTDLGTDPRYEDVRSDLLGRLYKGWDPEYVLEENAILSRDMRLITHWGQTVQPPHPDTLSIPHSAQDVEIL